MDFKKILLNDRRVIYFLIHRALIKKLKKYKKPYTSCCVTKLVDLFSVSTIPDETTFPWIVSPKPSSIFSYTMAASSSPVSSYSSDSSSSDTSSSSHRRRRRRSIRREKDRDRESLKIRKKSRSHSKRRRRHHNHSSESESSQSNSPRFGFLKLLLLFFLCES